MITDSAETCLNLEELKLPIVFTEIEEKSDAIVSEVQSRYNQIQERFVSLKTITETLKEKIQTERELWAKELKETVELEKELRKRKDYESGDKLTVKTEEGYIKNYRAFQEFAFFTNATKVLESTVTKNDYQKTLFDVESKCNMELLKIQHSMTMLKPLKDMIAKWNKKEESRKEDSVPIITENAESSRGDGNKARENDVTETDSKEEINMVEIKEILQDINEIISTADEIGCNENDLS